MGTMAKHDTMADDPHAAHINAQVEGFRKQLLRMTPENHLLNCPHSIPAQIRVVDELPDAVFQRLEAGDGYMFQPLPEPRDAPDEEEADEFRTALSEYKEQSETYRAARAHISARKDGAAAMDRVEREARDHVRLKLDMGEWRSERGLTPEELCRRHDIDPSYEMPPSEQPGEERRHHDDALQTLLTQEDLDARLRILRDRARSSISQTGVGTLFAAFGFLEWFESENSDRSYHAPP